MQETRGEIYTLPSSKGIWLDNIIKRMSSLYCTFEEKTDTLPNGINLSYKNISGEQIGPEISSFIMRSYIIKKGSCTTTCFGRNPSKFNIISIIFKRNIFRSKLW